MPRQELFFEQMIGDRRVEILKVYDRQVAREAFDSMDEPAQAFLWNSLRPEETYDPSGLPTADDPEGRTAFLWDELEEQAREDWKTFSYFVVYEAQGGRAEALYVSPDWPSAGEFAKIHIDGIA